jgi:hypothetical protein
MLLILIPIAWIFLMILFVGVCKMAAVGDAAPIQPSRSEQPIPRALGNGVTLWEDPSELAVSTRHRRVRPHIRHKHLTIHGVR